MDTTGLDQQQRLAVAAAAVEASARRRRRRIGPRRPAAGEMRHKVYSAIIEFKRLSGGDSPTLEQLKDILKLKSKSTVDFHLGHLEADGLIKRSRQGILVVGAQWVMSTDLHGEA